jgi:hypothetical protein
MYSRYVAGAAANDAQETTATTAAQTRESFWTK